MLVLHTLALTNLSVTDREPILIQQKATEEGPNAHHVNALPVTVIGSRKQAQQQRREYQHTS
jgi:hypothetical protein